MLKSLDCTMNLCKTKIEGCYFFNNNNSVTTKTRIGCKSTNEFIRPY